MKRGRLMWSKVLRWIVNRRWTIEKLHLWTTRALAILSEILRLIPPSEQTPGKVLDLLELNLSRKGLNAENARAAALAAMREAGHATPDVLRSIRGDRVNTKKG